MASSRNQTHLQYTDDWPEFPRWSNLVTLSESHGTWDIFRVNDTDLFEVFRVFLHAMNVADGSITTRSLVQTPCSTIVEEISHSPFLLSFCAPMMQWIHVWYQSLKVWHECMLIICNVIHVASPLHSAWTKSSSPLSASDGPAQPISPLSDALWFQPYLHLPSHPTCMGNRRYIAFPKNFICPTTCVGYDLSHPPIPECVIYLIMFLQF